MKQLIERSYIAIQNRGLINNNTEDIEFIDKLDEEFGEFKQAWLEYKDKETIDELIDFITVGIMFLRHKNIDFIEEFKKGIIKNEKRVK